MFLSNNYRWIKNIKETTNGRVLSTKLNPPVIDTLKYVFAEEEKDKELIILLLAMYNNLGEEILCVFTVDKVVSSSNSIVL